MGGAILCIYRPFLARVHRGEEGFSSFAHAMGYIPLHTKLFSVEEIAALFCCCHPLRTKLFPVENRSSEMAAMGVELSAPEGRLEVEISAWYSTSQDDGPSCLGRAAG